MGDSSALPLSIFMITKDEADRLPATLDALKGLSDDVIVVDSGSKDGTLEIAQAKGAKVFHRDWEGYGPQKRYAESLCRHDWLLNLDADERLSPELVAEIRAVLTQEHPKQTHPVYDAYEIKIAEVFPGEERPHPWAYTLAPVRLYRQSRGRYAISPVHDRVEMQKDAKIGRLKGVVHHFSVRSMGEQIRKLNAYTDQQVDDLLARGKTLGTLRVLLEFPLSFFKAYFLRRHFLRGFYGFITAMNVAFFRYLRVAKYYERAKIMRKNPKHSSQNPPKTE